MKKLLSVLLLAALVVIACKPAGEDGGAEYYISFLFDGERVEFTQGLLEFENVPFAMYATSGGTFIAALPQGVSLEGGEPETYAGIELMGPLLAGTYDVFLEEAGFMYSFAEAIWYAESGSVTVTVAGGVGAAVEGTFSGTVSDGESDHSVTDGTFRVKRIPDDSFEL